MGFAAGFQVGWNAVERAQEKRKQRELEAKYAAAAQDPQFQKYSQATADQMTAESNELNPDGTYRYRFEIDPGSTQYRRVENPYTPGGVRTEGYTPALGGLGTQSGPVAQAFGVPPVGLQTRVNYIDPAYEGRVPEGGSPGIPPSEMLGMPQAPRVPMGEQDGDQPPFNVPEPGYTPTLDIYDPSQTAAYQGLMARTGGGDRTYAPDRESYLGKEYALGGLSREAKQAALQDEYANILERSGKPAEAMQMRAAAMGLRKNALEMQNLEATAEKQKNLRSIQSNMSSWFKQRVGDRPPGPEDFDAFDTKTISELMNGGHVDEANAALDRRTRVTMERMKIEEGARGQAVNAAMLGLASGDFKPTVELYNKFVHDGARVQRVTTDPKTGAITVHRMAVDGSDLPDYTFKSAEELSAAVRSLSDAGSFAAYTQQSFMNNIRSRQAESEERRAGADERRAAAAEKRAGAAENRAERNDVVYLTDGKQVFEYKRGSLGYDKSGKLQLPEGMTIAKAAPTTKPAPQLTETQELAYKELLKDRRWIYAKTQEERARLLEERGIPPDAVFGGGAGGGVGVQGQWRE